KDNLNSEYAEKALRSAQSASECAWTLWPARPVGAELQKIGRASSPLRPVGYQLPHAGGHRVGVDNVLDRVAPVVGISGFEGAGGSKGTLAGCGPKREVSHARQPLEADMRQHAEPMCGRIEDRAEDVRPCELELSPQRMLRPALPFGNRCERKQ